MLGNMFEGKAKRKIRGRHPLTMLCRDLEGNRKEIGQMRRQFMKDEIKPQIIIFKGQQ